MSFIAVYDGIDGSGKEIVENAIKAEAEKNNQNIFFLEEFEHEHKRFPTAQEILKEEPDIVVSVEATFANYGKKLREEVLKKNSGYDIDQQIKLFAKDRHELFSKVLLPVLKEGIPIFQYRGYTSAIYQATLRAQEYTKSQQPAMKTIIEQFLFILEQDGNKWCVEHTPINYMFLLVPDSVEQAMQRIEQKEQIQNSVFQDLDFQSLILKVYKSPEYQHALENMGTEFHMVNTGNIDISTDQIRTLYCHLMKKHHI